MFRWIKASFWGTIAGLILRNRIAFLLLIAAITGGLATQWKNVRFTFTEANMLPDDHPVNMEYKHFLDKFGEEGNLILMALDDKKIYTPEVLNKWIALSNELKKFKQIDAVISIDNLPILVKDTTQQRFITHKFIEGKVKNQTEADSLKKVLSEKLPFYEGLIYNKKTNTLQTAVYMNKKIVNTQARKDFILNDFIPIVEKFEAQTGLKVHTSGMPYIRTLSAQNIMDEIGLFILAALLSTSAIFFFFFRSFRAMFISMGVVSIAVMWVFGFLGLFGYEITILTGLIPPLVIVIGIPNCVFLINKYQQEISKHGNQAKSLIRVIRNVGNVTLLTNLTTAIGFATFIFTESSLLKQFGVIASINVVSIFFISLLLIPIIYSYMHIPQEKHLRHLHRNWIGGLIKFIENTVKHHRIAVFTTAIALLILSIIGIYKIKISGSLIEDMPKSADFFDDITFFEKNYGGIMPLEITINTKQKNGVTRLVNLKRIDELCTHIEEIPEISKPLSLVNLVKYAKQAYYNGNPKYYSLPTTQEQNFILSYVKNSKGNANMLSAYVDSLGQTARITTFMKDIGTEKMQQIEDNIYTKAQKLFPSNRYEVKITGKAYLFTKGTNYLATNLIWSLALAILLIALIMAYMFRSFKMIVVSLIPNLLPLLITAGLMGYFGIPLKPSTILVFSIAFGISVDDTIHFLAKYRLELVARNWKISKSVYAALRETGVSMFYTSIVLLCGFSVFLLSSFGGTKALGGLISATLLFAMMTNLLLLPSLLLFLERSLSNKETIKEPKIEIFPKDEEEENTEKENKTL
ncbi:RND family transporter [Capnocytophaga sp. oral taxon 324]|uniref:efflux RND transporter permease subunit n=1 Tax=Capnocytophaga sp. oral taxon 324 TaxID=712211 RepID=UPI0002A1EC6A|nr:MMPL family transporter [Capnocytophaga sp. oral taxon 324]EKY12494.1 patched family protein [Capnocytophaga sp. oral taxon 324 str. F0483]